MQCPIYRGESGSHSLEFLEFIYIAEYAHMNSSRVKRTKVRFSIASLWRELDRLH